MYLRCNRRFKDGKEHHYWNIVESKRCREGKVVQRQVLYLGEINDSQHESWCRLIEAFDEEQRRNWPRIIPLFGYPKAIRHVIYTTNAIESLNASLRRVIRQRGSFPSDEAITKLLYLALRNITRRWGLPLHDWKNALNHFAILFEGRIPSY